MDASSPRWHEVTPSEYPWEREALAHIRELLPDKNPWNAWSNFTFAARDGRLHEVDLLIAGPNGVYLIEIKNYKGRLTDDGQFWTHRAHTEPNPVYGADRKSKALASYLATEARRVDTRMAPPFVGASVYLAEPSLRVELSSYQRHRVYVPDDAASRMPRLFGGLLLAPPERDAPDPKLLAKLPQLLKKIGISARAPSRSVGNWTLDSRPYDEGPSWQDFHAYRPGVPGNPHRRVRVYLEHRLDDPEARASVRRAAEREMWAAEGVHHPGILTPYDLVEHELGPALLIEQERGARRLDEWLVSEGDLPMPQRLGLVRQLVSAVAYAHRKGLVHRALSPRAVLVESAVLRVGEWQLSTRDMARSGSPRQMAATARAATHLDPTVEPYLAPEFASEGTDGRTDLDIFGVGAIAYLILTGRAPAASQAELRDRVVAEGGLDPATGDAAVDAAVRTATHPSLSERMPSMEDFLEALRPRRPEQDRRDDSSDIDPLEASEGAVLPWGYTVERVLGQGGSARAFLVRRDGLESVLKIGRGAEAEDLLAAEAAALEDLRHDHVVVLRRASFPVGRRYAIEMSHAGARTLADLLRKEGSQRGAALAEIGDQILAAVEYLDGRGVHHRDVKPANVGLRDQAADGSPQAILFDFSLAAAPAEDTASGTPGYLDPHLGSAKRTVYDSAAEQYAVAATLHELASGELPRWGDDGTAPVFVEEVSLAEHAFDPERRGALRTFFRRALAKAAGDRFPSIPELRKGWQEVFAEARETKRAPAPPPLALDIHVDVVTALRRLSVSERDASVAALTTACSPRPRLVAPEAARDERMRLLAVGPELVGVVLLPEGTGRGLLLSLTSPADAADYARSRTASVNRVSGELELRDAVALDRLADALGGGGPKVDLFAHVDAAAFDELGVDERIVEWARAVQTVVQLENAQGILPAAQYAVLLPLARGESVEAVKKRIAATRTTDPVDPIDLGAAVGRSGGQVVVIDDLAELRKLLEKPMSHFRTFLHPSQEKLAYRPNWGSAQVTGGPGTGKTVVALHRVKYLVEQKQPGPGKILLTTYTKGLAQALERDLRGMLDPEQMAAVQVVNIDAWSNGLVRERRGIRLSVLSDTKERDERWRRAAASAGVDQGAKFLHAEWEQVVLAQQITSEQDYVGCERPGRGKALPPARRPAIWRAVETFTRELRADGKWTHPMIADEAARLLAADDPPYEHVVVDEIQDLHPAHWRLVRAAVRSKPEDLFLTGDPHQRIYGHRVSLRKVGINIGGRRSTKLTLSYRTSAEILAWALRMLGEHHETGLDDVADDLAAYRSAFTGEDPVVVSAEDRAQEMADLAEALQAWHADGIDWEDIAVVARGQHIWRPAAAAMRRAGVPVVELKKAATGDESVRIGTMHGLKGLEFRAVAVVGVSDGIIPHPGVTSADEDLVVHRNETQDERNLLFVAATRPRERLRVSWHGTPSPFLP
ncbi:protein kinase domain-containing protein [Actinomycetospora sp. CA-084318]|uniref:protein kinase domain-containing protein n=1 Tax=Actinomycetospora sp. CA-084318 TaxID=3239892 RepID=UPI003D994D7B